MTTTTTECARCLGSGALEVCPLCGSTNIEDTDQATGCEHELPTGQAWYSAIDCPDCDGTGSIIEDDD